MAADTAWALFGAVVAAHTLGVMSPGPDFAMVTRQSLAKGRAAGVWTAAGIGTGILFHVCYGLFGLQWLARQFPASLDLIATAGALFLIWMGIGALRAKPLDHLPESAADSSGDWKRHFVVGLTTNVLNPKATLFFVALFTTIVSGPVPVPMMVLLSAWLSLSTFLWFATVAFMLSHSKLSSALQSYAHRLDHAMGLILMVLGLGVLAEEIRYLLG